MSKFVGIVIGVIELGVGIATGNVALIVGGALMIASSTATLLLTPSGDLSKRQASQTTLQLGEQPRGMIVGETAVGGSLVDAANWGGDYGTDWEGQIRALADHRCEGLTGFFVNDKFVEYTADGAVPGYNGQLEVYWRDGSPGQTLPAIVTDHFPGWTADDAGTSVAYIVLAYKADKPDHDNPVWSGQRPTFLPVVKGKRHYIARKDSTVPGGSGTHRWDDPSTWEWTDNPIDCRYNWSRGVYALDQVDDPDMLLVGRGLSAVEQPPANTFAPANLCDELVDGEKQFRVDGAIYANEEFRKVEERFALAVCGDIVVREGSVEIEPAQAKAPSFAITDADLIVGSTKEYNQGQLSEADDEWVNTVVPRYVEPDQKWTDHAAPVRRDVADIIADKGPREETVSLDLVKRAVQAGVVGEIRRRLGRLWGRASGITLGPRFAGIEEGDWGTWTSDEEFGGATKTFKVTAYQVGKEWRNTLQLREISSSVFTAVPGLSDGSGSFTPQPPPVLTAPASGDWTLSATTINTRSGPAPAIQIAGAVTMSAVEWIKFEVRTYNASNGPDDNWGTSDGLANASATLKRFYPLAQATKYEVSIRYRISSEWTPRLILGPVTTGIIAADDGTSITPDPTLNTVTADPSTGGIAGGSWSGGGSAVRPVTL